MADSNAKINLILCLHAHVPYGANESKFENVFNKTLKPCISNMYKYPKVQSVIHCSGPLLHYIERTHLELLMLIEDMSTRKQVEVLGGGFYEPMLPLLPLQDKIGQIEFFTTYLRKQFGKRPQGCWVPDLAWEQNIIGTLASCGMNYTFLEEGQFLKAGFSNEDILTPALTEEQGKLLTIFPLFHSIEKEIAQKSAKIVFKKLYDKLPLEKEKIVSVLMSNIFTNVNESADYAWNRFFEEISLLDNNLEFVTPSKIIKNLTGLKKACFANTYDPTVLFPRRFLIAFPEANGIYSKMIFTNMLINQLKGDKTRKKNAREEMWKAQGAGLFSKTESLYDHSQRKAAYCALLGAERITREKSKFTASLVEYDFNFDGIDEYLLQDQKLNCYIQAKGAGVFELDYLPRTWNYLDACNSQPSLGRRAAFSDILLPKKSKCQDFFNDSTAIGRYCAGEQYQVKSMEKLKGKIAFNLPPKQDIPFGNIIIEKTFILKKETLSVNYLICNHGEIRETFCFSPVIDLSFPGSGETFARIYKSKKDVKDVPVKEGDVFSADSLKILDIKNEAIISIASSNVFEACIKPRFMQAEGAELYQSTAIVPAFTLSLNNGESWANEFVLKFAN